MKKIILLSIVFLSIVSISSAQCFKPKEKFIDVGIGLGIQHYRYTDVTNNIVGQRDTSAAIEVPFAFEYGILSWLGASINGNYAKYFTDDSAANESVKSLDFVPSVNIHAPFGLNKLDLYGTFGYGYSHFSYVINTSTGGKAIANGSVMNLGLNLRLLFSSKGHLGMHFWYRYSAYNYNNGVLTDNNGNKADFKLDGPGHNFGIGLFFRTPID
ncbi:MAG: hypothetical protein M3R17_19950 [Bacteroidota bacterium]|nr:hypothetical protein [Bacteroidota bacterium]